MATKPNQTAQTQTEAQQAWQLPVLCPRCDQLMRPALVKTAIWHEDRLSVVEDIPAYLCDTCVEQYYDDTATERLRTLTENGFSDLAIHREILVPVYSLAGELPAAKRSVAEDQVVY